MLNLFLPTIFLLFFGLFNLLGIKAVFATTQLVNILVGFGVFLIVKKIGRRFFESNNQFFYWSFVVILIITYIIGYEVKGSKRWIDLYFFNFQASEFFKIFFIVFLASLISKSQKRLDDLFFVVKLFGFFILPTLIIFKQPDLGNAMVYVFIFFSLIFFSNVPKKIVFSILLVAILCLPLGWMFLKDYQKARFVSFINPQVDKAGTAYNMTQAIITIGSGKLLGNGLGLGTQAKLYFLPENQTDFAFASLIEQFGLIGGVIVICLYGVIIYSFVRKLIKYFYDQSQEGLYKFYYVLGFFCFFLIQVVVNIGMNLGLLPIAGIALPLISYGGSAIVTWMIGLALMP